MRGIIPGAGLLTALVAVGAVKLYSNFRNYRKEKRKYEKLVPKIQLGQNGNVTSIERFGDYVVRQMGLREESPAAKRLAKVSEDYLRGDKSRSDDSLENLFVFLNRVCPETTDDEIVHLNKELVKELDVCMVAYFSFHWKDTAKVIDQVIHGGSVKKKKSLKMAVLTATRKMRFQRVMKELKAQRYFSNVLEMMRAMGKHNSCTPDQGTVVVPADSSVRSPVLLLIGGGMGAGKSTVVKEIMQGPFWKSVRHEAVVVEADAFKETDVIYRALSSIGHGENISEAAELVHESSTNAASALLVTALNEGRDVILDGTMSWEPFVLQTIAMARDVHIKTYRMGPGYGRNPDGSIFENYWELAEDIDAPEESVEAKENAGSPNGSKPKDTSDQKKPYRIEFVGVICDAHMAVVRGMRRAILTKRGVPVRGQLRSHVLFTKSIEKYCELMDSVKIYSTSAMGAPPELIGFKDGDHKVLKDCDAFRVVKDLTKLNPDATSVLELYDCCESKISGENWSNLVQAPNRCARQQLLARTLNSVHLQYQLSELDLSPGPGSTGSLDKQLSTDSISNGVDDDK